MYRFVCVGFRYTKVLSLFPSLVTSTSRNGIYILLGGEFNCRVLLVQVFVEVTELCFIVWPDHKCVVDISGIISVGVWWNSALLSLALTCTCWLQSGIGGTPLLTYCLCSVFD